MSTEGGYLKLPRHLGIAESLFIRVVRNGCEAR